MLPTEATPIEDRPIRSLGVEELRGWKLKIYTITLPGENLSEAVMPAVRQVLEQVEPATSSPAVGFAIVHQGRDAVWLLVDLWREDILHQKTFRSSAPDRPEFAVVPPGGPTACIWELPVIARERDAYVAQILEPSEPRLATYLADVVSCA